MATNLPYHLGGHLNRTHIDEGVLDWVIKYFNVRSFLDIGCGPGGMVDLAISKNLEALGVDGDYSIKRSNTDNFFTHDYSLGPLVLDKSYDLVWSCEFVEHVEEKFLQNFMQTFLCGKYVILTYSPPGTPGHHHVNCQTDHYWIKTFESCGFQYQAVETNLLKKYSTMKRDFVRKFGLFFSRSKNK